MAVLTRNGRVCNQRSKIERERESCCDAMREIRNARHIMRSYQYDLFLFSNNNRLSKKDLKKKVFSSPFNSQNKSVRIFVKNSPFLKKIQSTPFLFVPRSFNQSSSSFRKSSLSQKKVMTELFFSVLCTRRRASGSCRSWKVERHLIMKNMYEKKLPVVNYTLTHTHTQREKNKTKKILVVSRVECLVISFNWNYCGNIRRPHVSHDTGLALYPMQVSFQSTTIHLYQSQMNSCVVI